MENTCLLDGFTVTADTVPEVHALMMEHWASEHPPGDPTVPLPPIVPGESLP